MFVKHGDGKIVSVIDTEELTEEQKKSAKTLSEQSVKQADDDKSKDNSCLSN